MKELPPGLEPYKRTPLFTGATVPAGLLKDHSTKEGTWGLINVEEGETRVGDVVTAVFIDALDVRRSGNVEAVAAYL